MVFWEKNIWRHSSWVNKYLYFSNLNFTMKGVTVKKAILRFFSGRDLICDHQKFQPWQTPPSRFLPRSPRFFTNMRCRYFSLNIWVVYDQLELDWCIFDQNWANSRPLHFQIFQILNATDRTIVQWLIVKLWVATRICVHNVDQAFLFYSEAWINVITVGTVGTVDTVDTVDTDDMV